ncbi:MAG: cation:proton antiporter [archaeon]|nr:cation:proton antiporter [archaeon]
MNLTDVLLLIAFMFVCAKISTLIFDKFGIPGLVGEITIGIIFASLLNFSDSYSTGIPINLNIFEVINIHQEVSGRKIIDGMAALGVMFLLFSVGLETRTKDMISVGKTAFIVALLGVLIPFILGFGCIYFFPHLGTDYAPFIGASMVATSIGVTAHVIKNLHLTNTKEARVIIGAAVIDDVLGMIILAIVSTIATVSTTTQETDVADVSLTIVCISIFIVIITLLAHFIAPWIQKNIQKYNGPKFNKNKNSTLVEFGIFIFSIIVCAALAYLSEAYPSAIIGAFLAGMMFSKYAATWKLNEKIEHINNFLVPFFFLSIGLYFKIEDMDIPFTTMIIVLAIIGKYIGCLIGAKISDKSMDRDSVNIISIGMIPRGEVGMIVASIGLNTPKLYSAVILMSIITTIVAPFLLTVAFRKKYRDKMKPEGST